jgi:hypothetical protein
MTQLSRLAGVAIEGAVFDFRDRRKQIGQRAHGCRFGSSAMAQYENAADVGIDYREQESELHLFLSDYRGERIDCAG